MSVDERRSALIEAAFRVIADHGVEGATTRQICAHADMPLASFHYAFESRTALLGAVMETAVPNDLADLLASVLHETDDDAPAIGMEESIEQLFAAFYDHLKADPGRLQATISLGIYGHNHPELDTFGRRMYERQFEVASIVMRVAAERAGVTWSEPVENLGPIVIAATNSITLIYLSTADDKAIRTVIGSATRSLMTYVVSV
ncbi:TetR family transcriptional regulator [Gordonia sp. ABSL1-1]|uniref:TetR/AcrR family transcriptional regulator n=1 Tax=Gordonia sp. ABSL1-1 TaxID=3053923 RepID=UPI0025727E81|nr:TetR family transcriptional regulator [Gordonia sp. ABSL1-1]MDL9938010.1 TetR family transcriptional regulator [Gordonia sp. ABSL1-1]